MTERYLDSIPLSRLIVVAESAARRAGDLLKEGFYHYKTIRQKSSYHDVVTQFDTASEVLILETIQKEFPSHAFITEESGILGDIDTAITWIIDPIDGTWNFSRQIPSFSISIAVTFQGDVHLGVIYNPLVNEWFIAEKGQGAHMNGTPIAISPVPQLQEAGISASLRLLDRLAPHCGVLRRCGSAALDTCYVAKGGIEALVEHSLSPWDIAAGKLIVEEAGGIVTTLDNKPLSLTKPQSILVATPRIHPQILELLHGN